VNRKAFEKAENIPAGSRNIVGGRYCWCRCAQCTIRSVRKRRACLFLHRVGGSLGVCCRNYWRLGYISQRTTKNNINEYRNKYNLTQEKLAKPSLLKLPGTSQITLAIVYLYISKSCP